MKKAIALALALMVAFSLAALVGCGDSDAAAKENLATDVQQLTTDLSQLLNPQTYESLDTFNKAWEQITQQYEKTVEDAQKVKDIEFADVESSWNDLEKAISNVNSGASLQENVTAIISAGTTFLASLQQLSQEVLPPPK